MKYVVYGELTKIQYSKLLEFALSYSQSFGVSTFKIHKKDLQNTYFDFFDKMNPYEEDVYKYILPQHYEKGQKNRIFKLNDVGKQFLVNCRNFWDWSIPNLPEDITFYRNKKMWLNCITHERLIIIESNDDSVIDFFRSIGVKLRLV